MSSVIAAVEIPPSFSMQPEIQREMGQTTMVRFGVIGYGYWGPNVVRNLAALDGAQVLAVCDKSAPARSRVQKAYPGVKVTSDVAEIVKATDIDAVAIVTPVWTHYELTKAALENGKHVFVEKPLRKRKS